MEILATTLDNGSDASSPQIKSKQVRWKKSEEQGLR